MTITFLDLYNECAGQPWSMFDSDAESDEDLESSLRISINKACSFLWNLYPWGFRKKTYTFRTREAKAGYSLPVGAIVKTVIDGETYFRVKYGDKFLTYLEDYELRDEETGEPEYFYIEGNNIYIYPTPDDVYTINITYSSLAYATDEDEEEKYQLDTDSDILNISEDYTAYEQLFKNCLISKAMMYAIADKSDENYSGYEEQYEDALKTLVQYCSSPFLARKFTW